MRTDSHSILIVYSIHNVTNLNLKYSKTMENADFIKCSSILYVTDCRKFATLPVLK